MPSSRAQLNESDIAARVGGARWGSVRVVAETGSTNADLVAEAVPGVVLIAEHQTAGRGRHARSWSAPPRTQVALSATVPITTERIPDLGWLSLVTGLAVADAVAEATAVDVELKWPNDVLIDGLKVAGILAELAPTTSPVAVIGLGINVGLSADELPVPTATSLELVTGAEVDREALAVAVLTALDRWLTAWTGDLPSVIADYRSRCGTLGQRVRVELPGDAELHGRAVDVDDTGRIVVRDDAGVDHPVAAGDVTHLRRV